MKVLNIKNDHLYKEGGEKEYGCKCKNCGTTFIFQEHEGNTPTHFESIKNIDSWYEHCMISCPNCNRTIKYSECTELKSIFEEAEFKRMW